MEFDIFEIELNCPGRRGRVDMHQLPAELCDVENTGSCTLFIHAFDAADNDLGTVAELAPGERREGALPMLPDTTHAGIVCHMDCNGTGRFKYTNRCLGYA